MSVNRPKQGYTYSVKVVNPTKKSDYNVRKLQTTDRFTSVDEIKEKLTAELLFNVKQVGYIRPGHGMKGKQLELVSDDDLEDMYMCFKKRDVLLWCYSEKAGTDQPSTSGTQRKHPITIDDSDEPPKPKRNACSKKLSEVEDIVKKLQEKHDSAFSTEKLNAWAHMIHVGKHSSYDSPPDLPYFRGKAKSKDSVSKSAVQETSGATCTSVSVLEASPGKRINMRSELLQQLEKWHTLFDRGGITKEQYDDLQEAILGDIYSNTFKS